MADFNTNLSIIEKHCYMPTVLEAVPLGYRVFLISLYSLTSLLAFAGNIVVIIVEIFGKHSANNLRKFLINLAISDIIFGVLCVPFSYTDFMLGQWIFAHWLCPVSQFIQLLSVFVTAFTLTLIGVERYLATIHTFSSVYEWMRYHSNLVLIIGWILGSLFASFWMPHTSTAEFRFANQTYYDCKYSIGLTKAKNRTLMSINFSITFVLPLVVLVLSYVAISQKLLTDTMTRKDAPLRRNTQLKDQKKPIKMMLAVVLLYALCWTPIKMYQIVLNYFPSLSKFCLVSTYYALVSIYFISHWMAMANSFVNPIIYSFMSKSFRKDFRNITNSITISNRFRQSTITKTQTSTV